MKVVINDVKTGQSFQRELDKAKEGQLLGKKLGETMEGGLVGLEGYTLVIRGGSSKDGVPMRSDVHGQRRVSALLSGGTGVRGLKRGQRVKKAVFGSTISADIVQLNTMIKEYGAKKLEELGFVPKPKEAKKAEVKK